MRRILRAVRAMMKAIWQKITTIFRVAVLVLSLTLLFVVSRTAIEWYQWLRTEIGTKLPAMTDLSGRSLLTLEWLQGNLSAFGNGIVLVAPVLLVLFVLLVLLGFLRRPFEPLEFLSELWKSLTQAVKSCWAFVAGNERWLALLYSLLKPGLLVFLLALFGVILTPPNPSNVTVKYKLPSTPPTLLPMSLHVNFDNAGIGDDRKLTTRGITLGSSRKAALQVTVNTLRECVTSEEEISIRVYGFASDDCFHGVPKRLSDCLNVQAANCRAKEVHRILENLTRNISGLKVEKPEQWQTFADMKEKRNSLMPSSPREAFADRVVVLRLSDLGICEIREFVEDALTR